MGKQYHTFEEWMAEVNREVERRCGLSMGDLPDQPYRDWYEDDLPPASAAASAVRAAAE